MEFNLIVNNATNKYVWMLVRVCCFHFAAVWHSISLSTSSPSSVRACVWILVCAICYMIFEFSIFKRWSQCVCMCCMYVWPVVAVRV